MPALSDVRVVLQAGGEGRRIRAVDGVQPKPMLTVGGTPMVERLLDVLVTSGFRRFTVATGFKGDLIEATLSEGCDKRPADVRINFHREQTPLGNAGVLGKLPESATTTLFLFADLVTDIDFPRLIQIHEDRRCEVTLASHYEEYQLSLGELQTKGLQVTDYLEKPKKQFLICSGIAALAPSAISVARDLPTPFGLADLVRASLKRRYQVTQWLHGAFWMDVNTPEALQQARAAIAAGEVSSRSD